MHGISKKYDVEVSSLTPSKVVLKGLSSLVSSNVMRATMEVKESRHTIVCRAAQEAGAPHREYINRKKENAIFTPM